MDIVDPSSSLYAAAALLHASSSLAFSFPSCCCGQVPVDRISRAIDCRPRSRRGLPWLLSSLTLPGVGTPRIRVPSSTEVALTFEAVSYHLMHPFTWTLRLVASTCFLVKLPCPSSCESTFAPSRAVREPWCPLVGAQFTRQILVVFTKSRNIPSAE